MKTIQGRRSIRLPGYDYSEPGYYFVTICVHNRICLFGKIEDGVLYLSDSGLMVQKLFRELPDFYSGIDVDSFIVMPNHFHGIIIILPVAAGPRACPSQTSRNRPDVLGNGQPQGVAPTGEETKLSLSDIVHRFKTRTTKLYTENVKCNGWARFDNRLWQRNNYEHVVRDENDLIHVRDYIRRNPSSWKKDEYYV